MEIALIVSIVGLGIVMMTHLAGFIWWAATLTNRVGHIEKWIQSNERLSATITGMTVEIASMSQDMSEIRQNIDRIFSLLGKKVDKTGP